MEYLVKEHNGSWCNTIQYNTVCNEKTTQHCLKCELWNFTKVFHYKSKDNAHIARYPTCAYV